MSTNRKCYDKRSDLMKLADERDGYNYIKKRSRSGDDSLPKAKSN